MGRGWEEAEGGKRRRVGRGWGEDGERINTSCSLCIYCDMSRATHMNELQTGHITRRLG